MNNRNNIEIKEVIINRIEAGIKSQNLGHDELAIETIGFALGTARASYDLNNIFLMCKSEQDATFIKEHYIKLGAIEKQNTSSVKDCILLYKS